AVPQELGLLPGADAGDPRTAEVSDGDDRTEPCGFRHPVGQLSPHNELARRVAPEEDAPPLQPVEVALLDRLPPELGIARDIGADVQAVLLGLELLDLVHPAPSLGCPKRKGRLRPPGRRPCLGGARRRALTSREWPSEG